MLNACEKQKKNRQGERKKGYSKKCTQVQERQERESQRKRECAGKGEKARDKEER